jgi:hypothetical protein
VMIDLCHEHYLDLKGQLGFFGHGSSPAHPCCTYEEGRTLHDHAPNCTGYPTR